MKKPLITLICLLTAFQVHARQDKQCVATEDNESQSTVQFTITYEENGSKLTFDKRVAWEPDALTFKMIYSGQVENTHLIAASSPSSRRPQLVEIRFVAPRGRLDMREGTLEAGDMKSETSSMAKRREYSVVCSDL